MTPLPLLRLRSRRAWRAWLRRHHAESRGVWLVFPKTHTGAAAMAYADALREALCFGWIDSLVKRLDDDRYARKFTPRTAGSTWSDINRRYWAELHAAGQLAPAGLRVAPTDRRDAPRPAIPDLPAYIEHAFRLSPRAWAFFEMLAPTYRRDFVVWVHSAKRRETREKRLQESIRLLAAHEKLGLK